MVPVCRKQRYCRLSKDEELVLSMRVSTTVGAMGGSTEAFSRRRSRCNESETVLVIPLSKFLVEFGLRNATRPPTTVSPPVCEESTILQGSALAPEKTTAANVAGLGSCSSSVNRKSGDKNV